MESSAVRNIWCVGRNYIAHAQELNNPIPEAPLIFLKAGTSLNTTAKIELPTWTSDVHHECELAVQMDANGAPIAFGLALDLTARDVQSKLKENRSPWTLAKSFKGACPIGVPIHWTTLEEFESCVFKLYKNENVVQIGSPKNMLFSLTTLLAYVTKHFPFVENDLLLTGTPAGVGAISKGDRLRGEIASAEGTLLSQTTWDVI